jgi:hypothetical protein
MRMKVLMTGSRQATPAMLAKVEDGSCPSSLRVIPSAQTPRKMPSFHHCMRAFGYGIASSVLFPGLPRSALLVPPASLRLAK